MLPPVPTATYKPAPKAMLFMLAPPVGIVAADVHVRPSALVNIEPFVPSATNWLENVTALKFVVAGAGSVVGCSHAVTGGLALV